MVEKIWEYLKHSIKVAWKSVFFNFKQYFCFFLAVLVVQVLYGMVAVSADNGNAAEKRHIEAEYNYHMTLKGLNEEQTHYVMNYGSSPFKSNQYYDVISYEKYSSPVTGHNLYDLFIYFNTDDINNCLKRFENTYQNELAKLGEENSSFSKSLSPLMNYPDTVAKDNLSFLFISLLLLILCVFLLTSLYRIRINHYKFEYGIYLTFGADFKMLYSTAFWELFIISVVTFVPSMAISAVISYFIYHASGYAFLFTFGSVIKVFIFSVLTIVLSVWMPMKLMSVKQPMSLIIAEDNSNLVTSPRSSFSIFGEKFPLKYEFYSIWRFRKYNLQVLTTAIVFCAMFIMALYSSVVYNENVTYIRPQFTVNMEETGFIYDENICEELKSIPGITAIGISDNSTDALMIASHTLIQSSDVLPFKNPVVYDGTAFDTQGEKWIATNDVTYTAMPEEQLITLENYKYSGDLNCLKEPGYVIVGDSKNNIREFKYEVGDKIQIAVKTGQIRDVESNETGRILMKNQIKFFRFEYLEFTIGAILYDIPCTNTPIFMSNESYASVTGHEPEAKIIDVYVDTEMTPAEVSETYAQLRAWAHEYGNIRVFDLDNNLERNVAKDRHYGELFIVISILILIISPIVWFFSQTLYYAKREKEFNILQAIGAIVSEIKQLCIQGGLCMASLSLIFSIALSYLGSYLLFFFFNAILPQLTGEAIRYSFYMPWYAIVTSVVVSVTCGFLSTYLPCISYLKHRYSLANGGAGADNGADE